MDEIEILFLESFPLQVHAVLKGHFSNGCTVYRDHNVTRKGNVFSIEMYNVKPRDAFCTEALVPFSITVPLDVYNLPAGTYSVISGRTGTEFTFEKDNKLR